MSQLAKTYDPASTEDKWYSYWMKEGYFHSEPDGREPYVVVIPPPNVTGVLHMGHMLNNTIQDVLVRRARMLGKNACWVPGTDHASIATEAKVVQKLAAEGIDKKSLSREEFLRHAWVWKDKHGGIILDQLKKLGASCDWERTRFTMEPELSEAVITVFIDLYEKGLIYRGHRMVNWDPKALTAVSDEEVNHKETRSNLYHVRYEVLSSPPVKGEWPQAEGVLDDLPQPRPAGRGAEQTSPDPSLPGGECVVIATTRPETILGDTAICVNPNDERYRHLVGKKAIVPLVERAIPIIADEYVDMEFGTGCLKVTPAHDVNDHELGKKHKLEVIDIMNPDGTLSTAARFFVGDDRFVARKKMVKELEARGILVKVEEINNKVGHSERTDAVIEPRLSQQWFVDMKKLAGPALEHVTNGDIQFHPPKFINTYRHWMENVHDWCISRQLWWGQRVPAWYAPDGKFVVARTAEEAIRKFEVQGSRFKVEEIKQDEDVVDTWFSSWLWPISVFDGFKDPDNADIRYYYPTNDLVTAPEILFFWVARMIMAGYEWRGDLPFKNVYLTGIVRDKQGRKMSKSLGNSPDPLDLIAKYGADGVRVGMLLASPAGNDLLFDEKLCEQGRNFTNKVWNSFRLIQGWEVDANLAQPENAKLAIGWFRSIFNDQLAIINEHYDKFRLNDVLMSTYKLVWDDFCSWYLEMIKPSPPAPQGGDQYTPIIDKATFDATVGIFTDLLKLLHPFTPFITEELWDNLGDRTAKDRLIIAPWPKSDAINKALLDEFEVARQLIMEVRRVRNEKGLGNKEALTLNFKGSHPDRFNVVISKLANLSAIEEVQATPGSSAAIVVKGTEYFIPLAGMIDATEEKARIGKELDYVRGFLASVDKKLSNERFVSGAPAQVLETERNKKADAEAKIKALEAQLAGL